MKKIFLIGDSIRQGYDSIVKEALKNVAEVYYPSDNCRFAEYVYRYIIEWKNKYQLGDDIDCVHWNCGLWDTLELFEDGTLTPIEVYKDYINRICRQLKILFPTSKFIFATSTPVIEERFLTPKISVRHNCNIRKFNEAAVEIVKAYGHEINDLYALVEGVPQSYYSDMTHLYTDEGTKLISSQVISEISKLLGFAEDEINYDLKSKENIEIIGF